VLGNVTVTARAAKGPEPAKNTAKPRKA